MSGPWLEVLDISEGGIRVVVGQPFTPGERFDLILTDGILFYTKEITAEVTWSRGGVAGLKWTDLTGDQEVWLRTRLQAWESELKAGISRRR